MGQRIKKLIPGCARFVSIESREKGQNPKEPLLEVVWHNRKEAVEWEWSVMSVKFV
jgi:hypothetical protein